MFFSRMFKNTAMPEMVAYRMNGYWYDKYDVIIPFDSVCQKVMTSEECVIKRANHSCGGKGVFFFRSSENSIDLFCDIVGEIKNDIVIQLRVKQCSTLSMIHESSLNTIRVISLLKIDGTVKIYSAVLRMGVNGSKVDNSHSGGIHVGINDNGQLKSVAYNEIGKRFMQHPTTGVKFEGLSIPNYDAVKRLVENLHPLVPAFRLVSWDIAINEENSPVLIEANLAGGGIDIHQLSNGPLFGNDTELVLSEVFRK